MPKTCNKCGNEFKGFGDVCANCRRVTKKEGETQTCEVCGVIFMGFGTKCDECSPSATSDTHCVECYTVAYPMERILIHGECFHRRCFKCAECATTLNAADYCKSRFGKYYCRTHFERLREFRGALHIPTGDEEQGKDDDESLNRDLPRLLLSSMHLGLSLGLCGALGARGQSPKARGEAQAAGS